MPPLNHPGVDLAHHSFFGPGETYGKKAKNIAEVFPTGNDTSAEIQDGHVVPEWRVQTDGADDYDSGTVTVARSIDQEIVQLLPQDTLRSRAIITNTGLFDVIVGKVSGGLSSGNGYLLKAATASVPGQSIEILTWARVFAAVVPSAAAFSTSAVSVWVERDKG